jgi:DivIVA domain-containing protein
MIATTKFRERYDVDQVDALLERVAASLDDLTAGRVLPQTRTAHEVLNARFQATKFRDGYDQDQVDDFLDDAIRSLKAGHAAVEAASRPPLDPAAVAAAARDGAARLRAARAELAPAPRAPGYSVAEVDELLDELARELDRRARRGRPDDGSRRPVDTPQGHVVASGVPAACGRPAPGPGRHRAGWVTDLRRDETVRVVMSCR